MPGQQESTAEATCTAVRVQGQDALAVRAARKLAQDELLLTGMAGSVLREAIQEGVSRTSWKPDTLAYADRWDEAKGR